MKITTHTADGASLRELGSRICGIRLDHNLTQAALAERAGVSKHTVERMESGEVAVQLTAFIRVCRALGLMERFDLLLPEPAASPIAQLKLQGRTRKRASRATPAPAKTKKWKWGDHA